MIKEKIEMDLIQELIDQLKEMNWGLYSRDEIINWLSRQGRIIQEEYENNL